MVVDNGQGSFEPLAQYLLEMDAVRQLKAAGRQTFLHCVVTGGQHGPSTLAGLGTVAKFLVEDSTLVIWQNEHFGPVDLERLGEVTQTCADRLMGPVVMVRRGHTFQEDVQEMLSRFMTFDEAIAERSLQDAGQGPAFDCENRPIYGDQTCARWSLETDGCC